MAQRNLSTVFPENLDIGLGRILRDAFIDGFTIAHTRNTDSYYYGAKFDSDGVFLAGAAKKTYMMAIMGDREDGEVVTGDSNDALLRMSHTNYAENDTNFIFRGINGSLANRDAGIMGMLEGINYSVRQRGDAGAITTLRCAYLSVQLDSGSGLVGTSVIGLKVDMRLEANCPTDSAGVEVRNYTDGVYTLPSAAFKITNPGTSGCLGFSYGLDMYDAAGQTVNVAELRFGKNGSEDIVLVTGNFADGADSGLAPGSLGLDTTDGLLFICDSGGLWQQVGLA